MDEPARITTRPAIASVVFLRRRQGEIVNSTSN
jgi:hypothetical protein